MIGSTTKARRRSSRSKKIASSFASLIAMTLGALCFFAGASPSTATAAADQDGQVRVRFVSPDGAVSLAVAGSKPVTVTPSRPATYVLRRAALQYEVASGENWRYTAELDLRRVLRRTVTLRVPGMHVRVINRSDEPREIIAGERHLGILKRGAAKTFGPLASGVQHIKTIGSRSRTHIAAEFTNRAGGFETVVLTSLTPGLEVVNPIQGRVRVRVDNRDYGVLAGKSSLRVLGLAPGQHAVELIDMATGRPYRFDAKVRLKKLANTVDAAVLLRLQNHTGERLVVPEALGGIHEGPIEAGASVDLTLPSKRFRLLFDGEQSGLSYAKDIDPRAGARQQWSIERPRGRLQLRNGTGEIATVTLDRFGVISLPIGARVEIGNVPAGRLQLAIETDESHRRFERGIRLKPGGDASWTVTTGRSALLVRNRWAEPIDLAIDGSPRGRIGAEAQFRVNKIAPGRHVVVAQTVVSKVREVIDVSVVDGDVTVLNLRPPGASLRLENKGADTLSVLVRGAEVGKVEVGQTGTFAVPSGRMAVEVLSTEPGRALTWVGALAPAQQIVLPNPVSGAAPIIVANPLRGPVTVRVDARAPVTVEPGKEARIVDLGPGAHLVEIRGRDFALRQRVRVRRGVPAVRVRIPRQMAK